MTATVLADAKTGQVGIESQDGHQLRDSNRQQHLLLQTGGQILEIDGEHYVPQLLVRLQAVRLVEELSCTCERSGAPIRWRIVYSPEVLGAIERYPQQPRGTLNRWNGGYHGSLLPRPIRNQFHHYRRFALQSFANNNSATMDIDNHRFAFFTEVMCRIKTGDDNRNLY